MEEALPIPVHDLKDVSTVAAIIEQSALFQTLVDLLFARDACICFLLPAHGTYDAAAVLCAAIAVLADHLFLAAAIVHAIGKIGIPGAILLKEERLLHWAYITSDARLVDGESQCEISGCKCGERPLFNQYLVFCFSFALLHSPVL